jgi:hypothetical protein
MNVRCEGPEDVEKAHRITRPRRAKTRLSPGKARSERKAEDVHTKLRVNRSF